jgi:hypothetical protein
VYNKNSPPDRLQCLGEQRPRGRSIRPLHGHRGKPGRFIDSEYGIVLVEDGDLAWETGRAAQATFGTPAAAGWEFAHWGIADNPPTSYQYCRKG